MPACIGPEAGKQPGHVTVPHRVNTDTHPDADICTNEQIQVSSLTRLARYLPSGRKLELPKEITVNMEVRHMKGNIFWYISYFIQYTEFEAILNDFMNLIAKAFLLEPPSLHFHTLYTCIGYSLTCSTTSMSVSLYFWRAFFISSTPSSLCMVPASPTSSLSPRNYIFQDELLCLSAAKSVVCAGFEFQWCTSVPLGRVWLRCRGTVCSTSSCVSVNSPGWVGMSFLITPTALMAV